MNFLISLFCATVVIAQPSLADKAQDAKQAMADGRFADAVVIYAELVRAVPDDAGMRLNLGMSLSMAGRSRDAIPHLQRAVALQPKLTPAWLFLGSALLETGDTVRAAPALRKVVEVEPENVRARELLGQAFLMQERFESAATQFRAATDRDSKSARAWFGLARTYEALARAAFDDLERIGRESAYAFVLRADALAASQQFQQASEFYAHALGLRPDLRDAREGLTHVYNRMGEAAAATEQSNKLLRMPLPKCNSVPASTAATAECEFRAGRFLRAVSRAKGSNTDEALYWLTRAYNELASDALARLSALPVSVELLQFRAENHRNQGRHLESVAELRKALELSPNDIVLQQELARSLYLAKSYDEALTVLEKLVARRRSPDVLFLYGDTLLLTGKSADAIPILAEVVKLEPGVLEARGSLGRAYAETGDHAAAIPHLEAALKIDEDGSVHYQLARAYQAVGKGELARQMMEKYTEFQKKRPQR